MNPSPEVAPAVLSAPGESGGCAYCGGPVPPWRPDARKPQQARYCCYGCRVLGEAGQRPLRFEPGQTSPWFKIAVGAVLAGQAMLLGLVVNLTPPAGAARGLLHAALIISSMAAIAILGRPLFVSAREEHRHRRVSIELLFLAGILGALCASAYSTLTGLGAVYYEVVAVLLTVYSIGKTLGAESRARAIRETRHLARTFETCHRLNPDDTETVVSVAQVRAGDQVRVLPGDPIPIDGRITRGAAFVCETPLTGEPFPVVRRAGDAVFAGSYSEDGELRVIASAPGNSRRLDGLLAALEAARDQPSRLQTQADRIVRWFLPLVLLSSLGTLVFWGLYADWPTGLFNALAVLLVACPCAMGLATPIALWNGLAALAARGLVARGGDVIDRLALLDRVVFDKTGTLSDESYSLVDLATQGTPAERAVLVAQLSAVQRASSHPVARAFRTLPTEDFDRTIPAQAIPPGGGALFSVRSIKARPALGVEAWLESEDGEERHVRVGRRELMSDLAPERDLLASLRQMSTDSLVYVEIDGHLRAVAAVRERLRSSAAEAVAWLRQQGLECTVMTGDRAEHAAALLPQATVWDLQGGLTPEAKAERIQTLAKAGSRVAFVGDGVNDAPAMRQASVGLALAHGAGVTTANADAVLYGGDLRMLPWAVALSRRVRQSIRSNLLFAAAYNTLGVILAATGFLHPVGAALLMVVSSFTVSWRALRSTEDAEGCCAPAIPQGPHQDGLVRRVRTATTEAKNRVVATPQASAAVTEGLQPPVSVERPGIDRHVVRRFVPATLRQPLGLQTLSGVLIAAQAPFLSYLGHLDTTSALLLLVVMVTMGLFVIRFQTSNPEWHRLALMTFAMAGPGNWGMILGWWADAGFAPPILGCPHCGSGGFALHALTSMPWMNLGMLLFGLPPMLLAPGSPRPGLSRFAFGLLSALGMVWGMHFGNRVFTQYLGPFTTQGFLLSFAGMTVGMLLGMFLLCEFGRSLALAWSRRTRTAPRRSAPERPRSGRSV
jgi:P-type Cu+ transporter